MTQITEQRNWVQPKFVVGSTPPVDPEKYILLLSPTQEPGNLDCNPFLTENIAICQSAKDLCTTNGFPSYFEPAFQLMINGRALDGFENVIQHQILVARMTQSILRVSGVSFEEESASTFAGLIHDADTPLHKLTHAQRKVMEGTELRCTIDHQVLFESEMTGDPLHDVPGIRSIDSNIVNRVRPTHLDWRGRNRWTVGEWALRAADSSVSNKTIVPWWERIYELKRSKPELDSAGYAVYGMNSFDQLGLITMQAFTMFEELAQEVNPTFLNEHGYPIVSFREICTQMAQGTIPLPAANLRNFSN